MIPLLWGLNKPAFWISCGYKKTTLLVITQKPEEVVAIGDNVNDKEMVINSGLGVVMGNSNPTMKEIGDVIVSDNNSEGVLEAINRFILN